MSTKCGIEGLQDRIEWLRKYGTITIIGPYGPIHEWEWAVRLDYRDSVFFLYEIGNSLYDVLAKVIEDTLFVQEGNAEEFRKRYGGER